MASNSKSTRNNVKKRQDYIRKSKLYGNQFVLQVNRILANERANAKMKKIQISTVGTQTDAGDLSSKKQQSVSVQTDKIEPDSVSVDDVVPTQKQNTVKVTEAEEIGKPFPCKLCKAAYNHREGLARHVANKHRTRKYECDNCGFSKEAGRKKEFERHSSYCREKI